MRTCWWFLIWNLDHDRSVIIHELLPTGRFQIKTVLYFTSTEPNATHWEQVWTQNVDRYVTRLIISCCYGRFTILQKKFHSRISLKSYWKTGCFMYGWMENKAVGEIRRFRRVFLAPMLFKIYTNNQPLGKKTGHLYMQTISSLTIKLKNLMI